MTSVTRGMEDLTIYTYTYPEQHWPLPAVLANCLGWADRDCRPNPIQQDFVERRIPLFDLKMQLAWIKESLWLAKRCCQLLAIRLKNCHSTRFAKLRNRGWPVGKLRCLGRN